MANNAPILVGAVRNTGVKLSSAAVSVDGVGSTPLFTADATNGSRIHSLLAVPTGTLATDVVARFFIEKGGTYWILSEKAVPAYTPAANVPAPATSFLEYADMPFLDPADRFLTLGPGDSLYVALLGAPANAIHFLCMGGDY